MPFGKTNEESSGEHHVNDDKEHVEKFGIKEQPEESYEQKLTKLVSINWDSLIFRKCWETELLPNIYLLSPLLWILIGQNIPDGCCSPNTNGTAVGSNQWRNIKDYQGNCSKL